MNWPLPLDYNEAVQMPTLAFADPDLQTGQPVVGPQGLPLPRSGNFADVYQIRGADGRDWAVKCFTRPVTGLDRRYQQIDQALAKANLPFSVAFTFLEQGIRVKGQWMPAVKMEWVEGLQLNQMVRENAGKPAALDALLAMWVKLCRRLREAGIAHADLQHGNVLLVPGSKPGSFGLKLIDYDGMYIPALANSPSGEAGHPNFQHPARAITRAYSPDLDRFSHLVVATALKALAVVGPELWDRYDTGDNLLFTESDFRAPANSKLLHELWKVGDPALSALVGRLVVACGKPLPQTPWLDQIAPEGVPLPIPTQAAAPPPAPPRPVPMMMPPHPLVPGRPAPVMAPVPPASPVRSSPVMAAPALRANPQGTAALPPRPKRSSALIPLLVIGGLVLVAGGVATVLLLDSKTPEIAQTPPNPDRDKTDDPPKDPPTTPDPNQPVPPVVPTDLEKKPLPTIPPNDGIVPPPRVKEPGPALEPDMVPPPRVVALATAPDAAALLRAEMEVRGTLKDDYARKQPAEKRALAQKLLNLAGETPDKAERFVMLRDAQALASEVYDPLLLVQAIDAAAKWYEVDVEGQKLQGLEKMQSATSNAVTLRSVHELAITASDVAFEADSFDAAVRYAQIAANSARKGNLGPGAVEDGEFRITQAKRGKDAFSLVKPAMDKLKTNPDDADANLAVGRFRAFNQGRWDEGLKYLAKGNNPALKAAAEQDLSIPRTGVPDVQIAETWWNLAQTSTDPDRKSFEFRARYWYGKAVAGLAGLQRAKAEGRAGFTLNAVEYRMGLVAEFNCKQPVVFKSLKARIDPMVDFNGGEFAVMGQGRNSEILVKWTGYIVAPRPGRYRLIVETPDTAKLRLDDKQQIDVIPNKNGRKELPITLTDRPMKVVLDYTGINNDKHMIRFLWIAPGSSIEEIIPGEFLYHDRKAELGIIKP